MADIDSQLKKSIEDSIQANRNINREMSQAIKTVTRFSDALDVASNTAIDKSADSLKQLLKSSRLLSEAQVDTIKSAKGLQNVVESLGRKQARLDELQEQYNKVLQAAIAKGHTGIKLHRIEQAMQQRLSKRLNDLGISSANAANASAKLQSELVKHRDLEKQLNKEISNLTSSASKAGKAVEDLGSRMLETAEKHLAVAASLGLLKKSLTELYGQVSRFADKGMFMAWRAINMGALRLKLSVAEFEEVISKNIDVINALGGGIDGIDSFTEALKSASKDLEMYGKDSAKIAAAIIGTVQRNTGLGPGTRGNKDSREAYDEIQKSMKTQFKLFNGGFGDTIENFTSYYDQVLRSEELQSKMNSLDAKGIQGMITEVQIRTENLKLMGLNNDQILEMTKRMETMFPRLQNKQGEAIANGVNAQNAVALLGQFAKSEGNSELGDRMQSKEYLEFVRKLAMSDAHTATNMRATQLGQQIQKDIATSRGMIEVARQNDASGAAASFKGQDAVAMMQRVPILIDAMADAGIKMNMAATSGQDHTKGAFTDKDGRIIGGEADEFRQKIKDMSGEAGLTGKAFGLLRASVDQLNSVINGGNGFTMMLGAATAAALLFSSALRGKVLGAITSFAGALMGKAVPGGGIGANLGAILPKVIKYAKILGGSLTAALGATELYQAYNAYDRGDIDEQERNKRYGSAIGSTVGTIVGGIGGGVLGTLASPGAGNIAGTIAGSAAVGYGGEKAGSWIGEKTGEKGKYKVGPFKGFGSEVDSHIKEASSKYGMDEKTLRGFIKMEGGWKGQMSPTGAIGTGQFIQSTWNNLANSKEGKDIGMKPITSSNFKTANDPRYDKRVNTLATALLTKQNSDRLTRDGVAVTGENLYMLHNIGPGVIPALKGSNNVTKETLKAMKQNGMVDGETPVEFVAKQKGKFNAHYAAANSVTPSYVTTTPVNQPTASVNPPNASTSAVSTAAINPPKVAAASVNTTPVNTAVLPTNTNATAPAPSATSPNTAVSMFKDDPAKAIVPLLSIIAENTKPSIVYDQKNYKPPQDLVLGAM